MRRLLTHAVALVAIGYAWRSLRLLRGWLRVPLAGPLDDGQLVSIIVPARDEERNVEPCVRSLLAQTGLAAEVIVVDDGSRDRTRAILADVQAEFPALRVIDGEQLPDGWVGKPWACAQGARAARGSWLLFTDADSRHAPAAVRSLVAFARAQNVNALTAMTGQEMVTLAERAILPSILGLILFASGDLRTLNDPRRPDRAVANGQLMLIERAAYEALGGHAAVRGEIVEDIEFAYHLKRDGRFRLLVADATQLVSVRMYRSFRELWNGFSKNVYLGAHGRLVPILGGVLFCAALSALPPLLALAALRRRHWLEAAEALAVPAVVIAVAWRGADAVSLPRGLAVYAPIGIGMFGLIALNSTGRALSGRGFEWRGRTYRDRRPARTSPGD